MPAWRRRLVMCLTVAFCAAVGKRWLTCTSDCVDWGTEGVLARSNARVDAVRGTGNIVRERCDACVTRVCVRAVSSRVDEVVVPCCKTVDVGDSLGTRARS